MGYCYYIVIMQAALINFLARVLSGISLRANHRIGAFIGWIAWTCRTPVRTITLINLKLCFPQWSEADRQRIGKASAIETGKALTESLWLWKRPPSDVQNKITIVEGEHLLRKAQQAEAGLIIATPHLGSWECACLPLVVDRPITCLYQPPRMASLEPLLIAGRTNLGARLTPLDTSGIKQVLTELKQGHTIGILPDQEPDASSGHFAPMFAQPANTMFLLAKFAHRAKAQVLFCFCKRLPKGAGWHVHYYPSTSGVADTDKAIATKALNESVEQCIMACPEQYLWNYKRFRIRPDGLRRDYKDKHDQFT